MLQFSPSISLGEFRPFCWKFRVILVHIFPRSSFRIIPLLCLEKMPFFSHSRPVEYETRRAFRAQSTVREAELSVRPVILIPSNLPSASLSLHPSNSHRQIQTHTYTLDEPLSWHCISHIQPNIHTLKRHTSLAKLSLLCDRNWLVNDIARVASLTLHKIKCILNKKELFWSNTCVHVE